MNDYNPQPSSFKPPEPSERGPKVETIFQEALDELVQLAATTCEVPAVAVTRLDEDWVWLCSKVGLSADRLPRSGSFCEATAEQGDLLMIPDLTKDARFARHPLVAEAPKLRFYAAMPLHGAGRQVFGTLCLLDPKPRSLSPVQEQTLRVLSRQVSAQFELEQLHNKALLESETWRRALTDSALDAVITIDHLEQIIEFNPAAERLFGWSHDEVIGQNMPDCLIPEAQRQGCRRGIARFLDTHASKVLGRRLELQALRRDGIEVPVELTVMQMGQHWPPRFTAFLRDLTDRKAAEAELAEAARFSEEVINSLRKSEERYRALFERAPDGILIGTPDSRYLDGNPSICRMLGYTHEELLTLSAQDIIVENEMPQIQPVFDAIHHGVEHHREWHFRRKDGSVFPVEIIATQTPDGNLLGMIRDITERKQLEAQFLRAQRLESIGTLAGGIAHDLNNSLSPILMALTLLARRFTDPASTELISLIQESANHGANMVKQVLSFSRRIEGQRIGLQLSHLIHEVEKFANDTFLKDIVVSTQIDPSLWIVRGDPTQLHQVLMNLCVNSRDAMPTGGKLTLSADNFTVDEHYAALAIEAKAGPYVVLTVEDTGAGMSPEVATRIFDPFFTTKEVGKGTGLGLSTTLTIIKSHGGFVRVHSTPEQGSKFEIFLPAAPDVPEAGPPPVDLGGPEGHGELILVVDDELAVRKITQQTLEAFGYRVLLAGDGAEALAVFAKHSEEIAAVFTDMTMPVMGGAAEIQILRKMKPTLPIVATSGLDANGPQSRAAELKRLGVDFFLEKPFGANLLLRTLKEAIARSTSGTSNAEFR